MDDIEYLKKYLHKEDSIEEALERLKNGEPVQYIVGDVNFYGNILKVDKRVLIPRRETEELVEKTQELIKEVLNDKISILDIGTGSGCIPITLKKIFPKANITGVDISKEALELAKQNAELNNVDIELIESDIYSNVNNKYDCIISNPPYLKDDDWIMDIVKNNEPHLALYADNEGYYFYEEILKKANKYLNKKNIIAFEMGATQGDNITKIAKKYFPKATIKIEKDLQKFDRFVFIINN